MHEFTTYLRWGNRVPRRFFPAVHGEIPNSLLQFYYLALVPGENGDKYVLIVRDYH